MGVVGQRHAPAPEAGWTSGQVLTGTENLVPTGIQYQDRPALAIPAHSLEQQVVEISLTNCADCCTVQYVPNTNSSEGRLRGEASHPVTTLNQSCMIFSNEQHTAGTCSSV